MNRVKKSYHARYVDRAKLLSTLRSIFGDNNFTLEFKEDHFVLTAPRELTEEELEECQF